jgi:hypothetical protein
MKIFPEKLVRWDGFPKSLSDETGYDIRNLP